jgi:WD40 repeat protein
MAASALHVYHSALPFVPKNSLLYRKYSHEESQSVKVLQGVESDWSDTSISESHGSIVNSIAFSPNGKQLASGSSDCTIRLWDTASGANTGTLPGHSSDVNSVAFSPNGKQLASGSSDCTIKLWDTASGANTGSLTAHSSDVNSVAFSPSGKQLASASSDTRILLWDLGSEEPPSYTLKHHSSFTSVAFSIDATELICGTLDDKIIVWNLTSGEYDTIDSKHSAPGIPDAARTSFLRINLDLCQMEISKTQDSNFRRICKIPQHYSHLRSTLSMSGRQIAFGCQDGRVVILSTDNLNLDI